MTTVWWVRHGPTHEKTFVGWRDVPADLSDTAQIARVADFLPVDAPVVSSDLIRARDTATAIAGDRLRLADHTGLREFNFGDWDGLHFSAVADRDPDLSRAFWETPGDLAPPNGESWNAVTARVSAAIDALIATHAPRDIVAVAHIGVIMSQIARVSDTTPYQAMGHHIDNLSVTALDHSRGEWRLRMVNHKP